MIKSYDLIVIQEIKHAACGDPTSSNYDDCAMKILFDQLQAANNDAFSYRMSDRLSSSDSSYKEQYAYVWRNSKLNVTTEFHQSVNLAIERPPFIGRFESFGKAFYTLPVHTRPDEAFEEVDELDNLWSRIENRDV